MEQDQSICDESSILEGQSKSHRQESTLSESNVTNIEHQGIQNQSSHNNTSGAQNSSEIFSPQFTSTQEEEFLFNRPSSQSIQRNRVNLEKTTETGLVTSTPITRCRPHLNNDELDNVLSSQESAVLQVLIIQF